jgi:hypothetical protein
MEPHGPGAGHPPPTGVDSIAFGESLAPALREACGGRLGEITWFRASWQHGGAATGTASWRGDRGVVEAFVKLPVGPVEHAWSTLLHGSDGGPTPQVFAEGRELGGYDLAWLVTEKLEGKALASGLDAAGVSDLLATLVKFQRAASARRPVDEHPQRRDWEELVARARENVRAHAIAEDQRWNEALKKVQRVVGVLAQRWESRPINTWCHGDLHPGNAMRRAVTGQCVLVDLALVHAGHWVEDGVYLERLHWAKPELLCGVKPVSVLGKLRRESGLPTEDPPAPGHAAASAGELANVRRVLMAAVVPAFLDREGHPRYTHAALEVLERLLPQVTH